MFDTGQKVVCVDDRFPPGVFDYCNAVPRKGKTYTVRDVVPAVDWRCVETIAVYLVEIVNRPNEKGAEPGFAHWRFAETEENTEECAESNYAHIGREA